MHTYIYVHIYNNNCKRRGYKCEGGGHKQGLRGEREGGDGTVCFN